MPRRNGSDMIRVENLAELQRTIRRLQNSELRRELRASNKGAAEIIADEAQVEAPVRSGRFRRSIKAVAGQRDASVKFGTPARVPYAGSVIGGHGPPRRQGGYNKPNPVPTRALRNKSGEASEVYDRRIRKLARRAMDSS